MKWICLLAFLILPLWSQPPGPDPVWEHKIPPFAVNKPVVRTKSIWAAERGKIWLGVGFVFEPNGPKFSGITPAIAGTQDTWEDEYYFTHVAEYVTVSGQSIWFLMEEGRKICTGLVPTSEPPKSIKVYSGQGELVASFTPNASAVIPVWEPKMGDASAIVFHQTRGEADTWKVDHSIGAYVRMSGDGGITWTEFQWIFPDKPVIPIPDNLKDKPSILMEIFSKHGMRFEITRFNQALVPGAVGTKISQ